MGSNTTIDWIIYACIGRLVISLWLKNPVSGWMKRLTFFDEMFDCTLCTGVWIYFIIAIWFDIIIVQTSIKIFDWFLVGMITSYVVYVFETGWKNLYSSYVITPESDESMFSESG